MKKRALKYWGLVSGLIIGYSAGTLAPLGHRHSYDERWTLMSRSERAGPFYQTRTCRTCGWIELHEIGK